MTKLKEVLKENNLKAQRIEKIGKIVVITAENKKYVFKDTLLDKEIFNYLNSRNFNYYPQILNMDNYQLTEYLEEINIPKEQKIIDLVKLVGLLHSKTTHYKEIDLDDYEKLYEDLDNNLRYLYSYYTDIISNIESKVFMSPHQQLLARNISLIYDTIADVKQKLDHWHTLIKNKTKQRQVIIHNNLSLDHFIRNKNSYLISWDKAKISSPVFDIYKLYKNHGLEFDFNNVLKSYENIYPLLNEEKELLYIMISMPDVFEANKNEYLNCREISKMIDKMYKTKKLISPETLKQASKH